MVEAGAASLLAMLSIHDRRRQSIGRLLFLAAAISAVRVKHGELAVALSHLLRQPAAAVAATRPNLPGNTCRQALSYYFPVLKCDETRHYAPWRHPALLW